MIDQAFYKILINTEAITNVVGTQIHAMVAPSQADLYITYQEIYSRRSKNIDNSSAQKRSEFQVDIFGNRLSTVSSLAQILIEALDGINNADYGYNIQLISVGEERSEFESETKLYRKSIDFTLFYD
tara:strand:+ start:5687 stop:6067 length:381 start_codon:yes stop_codon:yes gene_type:complete